MRVNLARVFTLAFERAHAVRGDDHRRFRARGLDQPGDPAFEAKAVHHNNTRIGDGFGVERRGLEDMRIAVRPDNRGHVDVFAADLFDEVGENREARDRFELFGGAAFAGRSGHDQCSDEAENVMHDEAHASRCTRGASRQTSPPCGPSRSETAYRQPVARMMTGPVGNPE